MSSRLTPWWLAAACALSACEKSSSTPAVVVPSEGGAGSVGASGGTLRTADGNVEIVFPAGALAAGTELSVAPATGFPSTQGILSGVYALGPEGTAFAAPVELSLAYDPARVPAGVPESAFGLATASGGSWSEFAGSAIDGARHAATAPVSHFSTWAVLTRVSSAEISPAAATLPADDALQLTATLKAANGEALYARAIEWSSSDAAVATVSATGLATGVAPGTATITVRSGAATATAALTVTADPGAPVIVTPAVVTTGAAGAASVAAHKSMSYRWSADGAVITSEGGAAGVTEGGRNSIAFLAGPVGPIVLRCVEIAAGGAESSPAEARVATVAPPGTPQIRTAAFAGVGAGSTASVTPRPGMRYLWNVWNAEITSSGGAAGTDRLLDQEFLWPCQWHAHGVVIDPGFAAAQTFTAGLTGPLAGVSVSLTNDWWTVGNPGPAHVAIHSVDGIGRPAEVLGSRQLAGTYSSIDDLIEFDEAILLTAGTRYAIVVSYPDAEPGSEMGWWGAGENLYPGGGGFAYRDGRWSSGYGLDLPFRVYVGTNAVTFTALSPGPVMIACAEVNAAGTLGVPAVVQVDAVTGPNRMFVTSTRYPATMEPAEYDQACAQQAAAAGLPGTYKAWLSRSGEWAPSRLWPARGWVRTDGLPFADSVESLIGACRSGSEVYYPPRLDQFGNDVGSVDVLTVTSSGGMPYKDCGQETEVGTTSQGSAGWTESGWAPCDVARPVYCFGTDLHEPPTFVRAEGRKAFLARYYRPSGSLESADAFCNEKAAQAGLGGSFKAFLAGPGVAAASRFDFTKPPWVRTDGIPVVASAADLLDGKLLAPITVTATGSYTTSDGYRAWTGAFGPSVPGTAESTCQGWSSTSENDRGLTGIPYETIGTFFASGSDQDCATYGQLYCLEE